MARTGLVAALFEFLARRSKTFILATAGVLILISATLDWVTPPDLRFFIFYWPPVAVVAWFVNRRWSLATAACATVAWLLADLEGVQRVGVWFTAWETGVNGASFVLVALLVSRIRDLVATEQRVARTDYVTGLANSRAFHELLSAEMAAARRRAGLLSVAYLDIDDFKRINDRLGHTIGDDALQRVASLIHDSVRADDQAARLGGDEFGILFREASLEQACAALDRLRGRLLSLAAEEGWPISCSVGLVCARAPACSPDDLIRAADALMYEAKRAGKNEVRLLDLGAPGPGATPAVPSTQEAQMDHSPHQTAP